MRDKDITHLLKWLFNRALVQHCASWILNVDFPALCRRILIIVVLVL